MFLPKPIINYIKEKEKRSPAIISEISTILRRSGHKNYTLFFVDNQDLVLLDMSRDITPGIITKGKTILGFRNTNDLETVTVNAYARRTILDKISDSSDLERVKEIFKDENTWVIHRWQKEDGFFEIHTHGMENYSHPNFRINIDIGEQEACYLFNTLCRAVQRGHAIVFEEDSEIGNLYGNYNVKLTKTSDFFYDVELIELELPSEESKESTDAIPEPVEASEEEGVEEPASSTEVATEGEKEPSGDGIVEFAPVIEDTAELPVFPEDSATEPNLTENIVSPVLTEDVPVSSETSEEVSTETEFGHQTTTQIE